MSPHLHLNITAILIYQNLSSKVKPSLLKNRLTWNINGLEKSLIPDKQHFIICCIAYYKTGSYLLFLLVQERCTKNFTTKKHQIINIIYNTTTNVCLDQFHINFLTWETQKIRINVLIYEWVHGYDYIQLKFVYYICGWHYYQERGKSLKSNTEIKLFDIKYHNSI